MHTCLDRFLNRVRRFESFRGRAKDLVTGSTSRDRGRVAHPATHPLSRPQAREGMCAGIERLIDQTSL
jgi:hypothetical protein